MMKGLLRSQAACWTVAACRLLMVLASLSVASRATVVRVVDTTIPFNQTRTVVVELDGTGVESAFAFSLSFDPGLLTYVSASAGAGASGALFLVNDSRAANGQIGVTLVKVGATFANGKSELLRVTLTGKGTSGTTSLSFGDTPLAREVNDVQANSIGGSFTGGTIRLNTPPVAAPQSVTTDEDTSKNLTLSGTDGDNHPLTFTVVDAPSKGVLSGTAPSLIYTPNLNQNGQDSFTFKANDGFEDSPLATVSIVITPVNDAPVIGAIEPRSVNEEQQLIIQLSATDVDLPANEITWSLSNGAPPGVTINATSGALSWTPTEAQGPGNFQIVVIATDNGQPAASGQTTISVAVNEVNVAPVVAAMDPLAVNEGALMTVTANATDVDQPVNSLTFSLSPNSPPGASIHPTTGVISWTPTETQGPGTFQLTVIAEDNGLPPLTGSQTFQVTVNEANLPPVVASIADQTVNEGDLLSLQASATDADQPANTITYSLAAGAPVGAAIEPSSGLLTWTPTEAQGPGTFPITVLATDNGVPLLSGSQTFRVTVNEVNVAPVVALIENRVVNEGQLLSVQIAASDADTPANALTYSLGPNAPTGVSVNPSAGLLTWTPTEAQGPGTFPITVVVADNGQPALTGSQTFTVTVNEVNAAPVVAPLPNQTISEGQLLSLPVSATDADLPANTLTLSLSGNVPVGVTFDPGTGTLSWTPGEAQGPSTVSITVTATDNGQPQLSGSQTFTITVNEVNSSPVIPAIDGQTVAEGSPFSLSINASDPDLPANSLTFSLAPGAPNGMSISPGGQVNWTPSEAQGPGTFTVTVQVLDNGTPSLSASQSFSITVTEVNSAPALGNLSNLTVAEGSPISFVATATDSDLPPQNLTFSLTGNVPDGATLSASGQFNWTPNEAQGPGTFNLTATVTDSGGLSASQSFTITVTEANQAPVLAPLGNQTVNEGSLLAAVAAGFDADLPAQALAYRLGAGAPDGASINPTSGVITWTPSEAQGPGTFTITVIVSDSGGLTANVSFTVNVVEINQAPVLGAIGVQRVNEGSALSFQVNASDADLPAQTLTHVLLTGPQGLTMTPGGVVSWTPEEFQGPSTNLVLVQVTDNGVPASSVRAEIIVVAEEVNQAPSLAAIGNQAVRAGQTLTVPAQGTDGDLPPQVLSYRLVPPVPAGVTINAGSGLINLSPSVAEGGTTNQVTVEVSDNFSPPLTAQRSFQLVVTPANSAPALAAVSPQTASEGVLFTLPMQGTDSDLPVQQLTYSLAPGAPTGMTINPASGVLSWTPAENQGPTNVTVTVILTDNGQPPLNTQRAVTVNVLEVNQPPEISEVPTQTVAEGSLLTVAVQAVDPDIPPNTVTYSLALGAPQGMLINTNSGVINWTPGEAQGPSTNDVVVVAVDNGVPPGQSERTVRIVVTEVNAEPVLNTIANQVVDEGQLLQFQASGSDPDLPLQTLTFSLDPANTPAGMTINPTNGVVLWTPSELQGPGTNVVTVRLTDNGQPPLRAQRNVTVVVREVNVAPTITAIQNQSIGRGDTLRIQVQAQDADRPQQTLAYSLVSGPANATLNSTNGLFLWTPTDAQSPSTNNVTLAVSDGAVPPGTATVNFQVVVRAAVNLPPTISNITNATIPENGTFGPALFTVSDPDTPIENFQFQGASSNTNLVRASGITLGGTGTNRTVTVRPELNRTGQTTIAITVQEPAGGLATTSFGLTVQPVAPSIAQHPVSRVAVAGSAQTMSVVATGTQPLGYQWLREGVPLAGRNNNVLLFTNVTEAQAGAYSVLVSNAVGQVESQVANMTVQTPLAITQQPADQSVVVNASVIFRVEVAGSGTITFQWRKDGQNISGATQASFSINSATPADQGNYSVVVTSPERSLESRAGRLEVREPPRIVVQPASQNVIQGTNVTFSVQAQGTPTLLYQWTFKGTEITGATSQTLTVSNVTPASSGDYRVEVRNAVGNVTSEAATLSVQVPPTILQDPQPARVVVGGRVELSVAVSGTNPQFQWRQNGTPIPGATNSFLIFTNVTAQITGDYTVAVSNVAGTVISQPATVTIVTPVEITQQPQGQTVNGGTSVTFTVAVSGTPTIFLQWQRNGVDIPGETNLTYVITAVQRTDAAVYQVVAQNEAGPVTSSPAILTVNEGIRILAQPVSTQSVASGSTVLFSVEVVGTEPITFQWRKDGTAIGGAIGRTLVLNNVTSADNGAYSVVITNPAGSVTSNNSQLTVIVPPTITQQPANLTVDLGGTATFNVTVSGDPPISFQWLKNGTNLGDETNSVLTISNVQSTNSANYSMRAQNAAGSVTTAAANLSVNLPPLPTGNTAGSTQPIQDDAGSFDAGSNLNGGVGPQRKNAPPGGAQGGERWFAWQAAANGVATFNTAGSTFDTELAVFQRGQTDPLVQDDDGGGFFTSEVRFNAQSGTIYDIRVRGFQNAGGEIVVNFQLNRTALQVPIISAQPQSVTVARGENATLSVTAIGSQLTYQWLQGTQLVAGATSPSFTVNNVQEANARRYKVRVSAPGGLSVESAEASIQIGRDNARAVDKFGSSPVLGGGGGAARQLASIDKQAGGSVARGFSGSQVFSTFGSTKEQGEPNHCDEIGGASQWFTYSPPENGVLRLTTDGSDFDTVLAVYTAQGDNVSFDSLQQIACNNNGGADGLDSALSLPVTSNVTYYIAVDGVNGASGTVALNFDFGVGPTIVQHPQDIARNLGQSAVFTVIVTNTLQSATADLPEVTYQWIKDGVPLENETRNNLAIAAVNFSHLGDYRVVANSFAGSQTSLVARLTVSAPVQITAQPIGRSVAVGELVTFETVASGTAPISFQWRKDGVNIPDATNRVFTITSVDFINIGRYRVLVSNPSGTVLSEPALLSIAQRPFITVPPVSQTVSLGQGAQFSVVASGSGELGYQWKFNGVNITGETRTNLVIQSVSLEDIGEYTVLVGSAAGSVESRPASLILQVPLNIVEQPRPQNTRSGSSAVFNVRAVGTGQLTYQWRFNDADIPGATSPAYTISNVQTNDAGIYRVIVRSGAQEVVSEPAALTVDEPPSISEQPASRVLFVGGQTSLSVTAAGTEPLFYQWTRNDEILPGATNRVLQLENVQLGDAGNYLVRVTNSGGEAQSSTAVVTVQQIVSAFRITRPDPNTTLFSFRVTIPEGSTGTVEASDDLLTWIPFTQSPINPGVVEIEDSQAGAFELRYYRVRIE